MTVLGCRRQDRIPCVALRHRLHLRALPPVLLRCRLRWFGHAARRPAGEIIREVIKPGHPAHWRKKRGGQLKTWMTLPASADRTSSASGGGTGSG